MSLEKFYNKNYKKLLIIPVLLFLLSFAYLGYFYSQNQEFVKKDVTLTGGTTIKVETDITPDKMGEDLSNYFDDYSVRSLSDNAGQQTQLVITLPQSPEEVQPKIEEILGFKLTNENSSIEFTGGSLSKDFYRQLISAVLFAFLLMAWVVFFIFGQNKLVKIYTLLITLVCARLTFPTINMISFLVVFIGIITSFYGLYSSKKTKQYIFILVLSTMLIFSFLFSFYLAIIPLTIILFALYTIFSIPSTAVALSAFGDILIPLVLMNLFQMKLSSAGIVAFLMMIGYSVDTDILLTTRILKKKHSINQEMHDAFKTGLTMTITSIVAVTTALIVVYNFQSVLNQIFTILLIGLSFDIINTWTANASIIKWYAEKNK